MGWWIRVKDDECSWRTTDAHEECAHYDAQTDKCNEKDCPIRIITWNTVIEDE
ncbi:hypothetical protein LCGC14_1120060 [marine sediment metagenome]|uniref:Uncharacterized protein n=1 Tax=marine sediment metagenome TaxID=412755 RepID=A0A0F9PME5_9ZZZZ